MKIQFVRNFLLHFSATAVGVNCPAQLANSKCISQRKFGCRGSDSELRQAGHGVGARPRCEPRISPLRLAGQPWPWESSPRR